MKKNLRIVSAAAAALLAVAPVAAGVVPAANVAVSAATSTSTDATKLPNTVPEDVVLGEGTHSNVPAYRTADPAKTGTTEVSAAEMNALGIPAGFASANAEVTESTKHGNHYVQTVKMNLTWKGQGQPTTTQLNGNVLKDNGFVYLANNTDRYTLTFKRIARANVLSATPTPANSTFTVNDNLEDYGAWANGQTVYVGSRRTQAIKSISELKTMIENLVKFNVNGQVPADAAANHKNFNDYAFGKDNATNDSALASQLSQYGISVNSSNGSFDAKGTEYRITVHTNANASSDNPSITFVFQNTGYVDSSFPLINFNVGTMANPIWSALRVTKSTQSGDTLNVQAPAVTIEQNDDKTQWQPSKMFNATVNGKSIGYINATFSNDTVDITKTGIYSITVTAKNAAGKTVVANVPVVVSDANGKMMTVSTNTNVYSEQNGSMVQANLLNFHNVLTSGSQVKVFGNPITKKLNGQDVQFYHIVSLNSNFYVRADALKGYEAPATAEKTVTKTVNHIAAIYNKEGKQTNDAKLRAYNPVTVLDKTVTINGSKMYQIAENGKGVDKYVKASNIDGVSKTLTKNSYVYTAYGKKVYKTNGKAVKMPKKGHRSSLRKETAGKSVTVYGGALFNKQFYRIGHNQYIKAVNFR